MKNKYTQWLLLSGALLLSSFLSAQCPGTVSAGDDQYFCKPLPNEIKLNGQINGNLLLFSWDPFTQIVNPSVINPTIKPITQTTSYSLNAYLLGNNVIVNGDFEQGPKAFTSDYVNVSGSIAKAGSYDIVTNPQDLDINLAPCEDHTGKGNMMVMHCGLPNGQARVWCQDVPVTPNTLYTLNFYTMNVTPGGTTPGLWYSFNSDQFFPPLSGGSELCKWQKNIWYWDSGTSTTLSLCIGVNGDDTQFMALDDIGLFPSCQIRDTVTVHVAPELSALVSPGYQSISTCKPTTITLNGFATAGPNITYQWDTPNGHIVSGANTLSPKVDESGTYNLTVTFKDGPLECTATAFTEIEFTNPTQAFIQLSPDLNCRDTVISLVGGSSVPGPTMYQWTASNGGHIVSGANQIIAKVNEPGEYTLVITNVSTGCTAETSTLIQENIAKPLAIATAPPLLCSTLQTELSGKGSSTGNNFTYAWTTPNGNIVSGQDSIYALADTAGTYILLVTNEVNHCTKADTIVVVNDTLLPIVNLLPTGALNCETTSLTLSSTVTPADAVTLWTASDGGLINGPADTTFIQVNTPGVYTLTVTNPVNGCTVALSDTVAQNITPPIAAALPANSITCTQSSTALNGQGSSTGDNFTYSWTTTNGNIVSGENTISAVANAPGQYTLVVTNTSNGCTASTSISVQADLSVVLAFANAPDALTCTAAQVTLNATGSSTGANINYAWSTTNGTIVSGGNGPTPIVSAAGVYTLLVTNTTNGCTSTDIATVVENTTLPGAALAVSATLNCSNASVELSNTSTADPALLDFVWTLPGGSTTSTGNSPSLNATQAGQYQVLVTNTQTGCTSTATATVIQHAPVAVALGAKQNNACFGDANGSITVSASGGDGTFSYAWTGAGSTNTLVNLPAGTYTVTVTDGENCTSTLSATIEQPGALAASSSSTEPSATGSADGTASVSASGGTPGYTYLWSNDGTTATISGLTSGFYTVTITDANGCTLVQNVEVGEGNCNLLGNLSSTAPACNGQASGSATIDISGGSMPFAYNWSSGSTDATANGLVAGTYTVVVTDVNDCQFTAEVTLTDPALLTIETGTVVNTSCANLAEGSASVVAGGGTGALNIQWDNGQTGPEAINLEAGTYTAVVTDANGCSATATATVGSFDQQAPTIQIAPATVALGPSGSVTLTATNTSALIEDNCGAASVAFTPEQFNCQDLGTHVVVLTATDASGNSSTTTATITIVDNTPPTLTCPSSIVRCSGDDVVPYVAPVATDNCLNLGGSFNLVEGLPSGSSFPEGLTPVTYSFTDAQGNTGTCSFQVTILAPLTITLDSIIDDLNGQQIGGVQVTVAGSQPGYTYQWLLNGQPVGAGEDLSGVGIGEYTLLVTDAQGCTSSAGPFQVDNLVGTGNPELQDQVGVFPNPTTGVLYVLLANQLISQDLQISVFDATGRSVLNQHFGQLKQTELNLSDLPKGLYSVIIRTGKQQGIWKIAVQ
ncbi:MAG: HYR domain-containing protein [Saprospiraceae bacterium]|nr:HYR domain-containing protein [Saprospiraceae bacterium]